MNIFDKFFKPYADYCLRTTFSEDELKEVFEEELPSYDNFISIFKLVGNDEKKVCFFKTKTALVIRPVMYCRNSLRGVISIKCGKVGSASETLLHITIAPPDISIFLWIILCFSIGMGILMLCAGLWQAVFPWFTLVFLFVVLAVCRSSAEQEIPKIRQAFENTLRHFEDKYRGHSILIQQSDISVKKINFLWSSLLLIVPIVLVLVFDRTSTLSFRNFAGNIAGTIFFIDFPIGMCLLYYYFPQLFRHNKSGHYSIVPWGIFFLVCWGIVALGMFLATRFGEYPENGFSVVCAYLFGWAYIWFTMIPIGLIYLLIRGFIKLWHIMREKRN